LLIFIARTGSVDSPFGSAVGRVLDAEGVRGLWRGFLPAIIAYFPSQALSFGLRDYFRTLLPSLWAGAASVDTTDDHPPSGPGAGNVGRVALWFATRVAAGALAGAATLTIIYPLHFASVQLMADVGRRSISGMCRVCRVCCVLLTCGLAGVVEHQFEGTWDVWRQAVARSGFGGLYHGLGVSLAGVLVFRGLYFGAYDLALYLLPAKLKRNDWVCFLTAVGVTVGSAFVAYPLDTIRYAHTRAHDTRAHAHRTHGTWRGAGDE